MINNRPLALLFTAALILVTAGALLVCIQYGF